MLLISQREATGAPVRTRLTLRPSLSLMSTTNTASDNDECFPDELQPETKKQRKSNTEHRILLKDVATQYVAVCDLHSHDVLCGRGGFINKHR